METTINEVFKNRAGKYADRLAVEKRFGTRWDQATWKEYYERSRAAGLGLLSLGVSKGDRVSLLSENRLEWLYTDMGVFDKTLLFDGWSIGGLFWLVKKYFASILHRKAGAGDATG